jgi:hypothetical protein
MEQLAEHRVESRPCSWRDDLPVAATAAVMAGLGWASARMAGIDLTVRSASGSQRVNVVSVVVVSVVVTLVAGALLRRLERRTDAAIRIWSLVVAGVLLVSLAGPLGAESLAAGLALAGLHVIVAGVVAVGLLRRPRHALA